MKDLSDLGYVKVSSPATDGTNLVSIGKSERDIAMDLRDRMRAKLSEVGALLDEANRAGMRIGFQMGVDAFGRNIVATLDITKPIV